MNFNIIENSNFFDDVNVEEFKKDFYNLTNNDMLTKYDMSYTKFKRIIRELGLKKRGGVRSPKHYYYMKNHKRYIVQKQTGKKNNYFGIYKTEEEAKKVVEHLKKHDWSKESLKDLEL